METSEWKQNNTLAEFFSGDYHHYSFHKVVSLLESALPENRRLEHSTEPDKESVRFKVIPDFSFQAGAIFDLLRKDFCPADIVVNFMGLIGPSGVLPDWYNEMAYIEDQNYRKQHYLGQNMFVRYLKKRDNYQSFSQYLRLKGKNSALTDFLNIFHHRLITLFYLAWKKNRLPEIYLPESRDPVSKIMLSLLGLGLDAPENNRSTGFSKDFLLLFSGLLSKPSATQSDIETLLENRIGVSVRLEQFIERQVKLSTEDQTFLGGKNSILGIETTCGIYAWENQTYFRIHLGPMKYDQFLDFMPTNTILRDIFLFVRYVVGMEYEFDIRIYLDRKTLPSGFLNTSKPMLLGWTSFILSSVKQDSSKMNNYFVTFHESDVISNNKWG